MTKEQAHRLDAAIAKNDLRWWEVLDKIGLENLNDHETIEKALYVLEKMASDKTK